MHSFSHLLNDWGLEIKHKGGKFVLQEKIHVLMSTVFDGKMLKGRSQENRDRRVECKMEEAFPSKIECNFKNKQRNGGLGNTSNVNRMFDGVNAGRRGYSR